MMWWLPRPVFVCEICNNMLKMKKGPQLFMVGTDPKTKLPNEVIGMSKMQDTSKFVLNSMI